MRESEAITLEEIQSLRESVRRAYVGFKSWEAVGKRLLGKSGGYAWKVANDPTFEPKPSVIYHWREFWVSLPDIPWGTIQPLKDKALAIISACLGPKNAITVEELARDLAVIPRRARATVRALRKEGYPICTILTRPGGYFWPISIEQFWEYHKRYLWSRAADLIDTCGAMEIALPRWFESKEPVQLTLTLVKEVEDVQRESISTAASR